MQTRADTNRPQCLNLRFPKGPAPKGPRVDPLPKHTHKHTHQSIDLSIYPSLYLPIYLPICVAIDRSIDTCIYHSLYLSIHVSIPFISFVYLLSIDIYLSSGVYLSIYRSLDLSIYQSIYLSTNLSTYLFFYLFIYLSIYLSIYLIYLSNNELILTIELIQTIESQPGPQGCVLSCWLFVSFLFSGCKDNFLQLWFESFILC